MKSLLLVLLDIGLSALGKLADKFFKSKRGKKIRSFLPDAAQIVAIVAARTDTKVDDAVAKVAAQLGLGDKSVEELLTGPWGDIIRAKVAALMVKEKTGATDSEANQAVEMSLGLLKDAAAASAGG